MGSLNWKGSMLRYKAATKHRNKSKYSYNPSSEHSSTVSHSNIMGANANNRIDDTQIKVGLSLLCLLSIVFTAFSLFEPKRRIPPPPIHDSPSFNHNGSETMDHTCNNIKLSGSLKETIAHQDSFRPYNQTCVCCQSSCGIQNKSKVIGARWNLDTSHFDVYPKIIDLFNS